MSSEFEVTLVDREDLEVELVAEDGNLVAYCSYWCEAYGRVTRDIKLPPQAEAALLRLLLSRLDDAQRWELFRELAGELLPAVRHEVVEDSREDEDGEYQFDTHLWATGEKNPPYVTGSQLELVTYEDTWDQDDSTILATTQGLRQMAAYCLAAADELERREVQS